MNTVIREIRKYQSISRFTGKYYTHFYVIFVNGTKKWFYGYNSIIKNFVDNVKPCFFTVHNGRRITVYRNKNFIV